MGNRAFRYRAYLTDDQFELAMKTVGSCRYVYNKALEYRNIIYQNERVSVSYSKTLMRFISPLTEAGVFSLKLDKAGIIAKGTVRTGFPFSTAPFHSARIFHIRVYLIIEPYHPFA